MGKLGKIFISYRRGDVPGDARGVHDRLARVFDKANVFMDVDRLLAGQRFDRELDKALTQCNVLLAVIGPRWMELLSAHAREGDRDFVRDEIAAALKRDIVVIPVLIGRQGHMPSLPRKYDLPEDIRDLVLYQKHDIAHESFKRDADHLAAAITSVMSGGRRVTPWRATLISGAIALTMITALLSYRTDLIPWIRPGAVQPRPATDAATVLPQANRDADREARAAEEAAKKKAAEEDANKEAATAAKRQADADAAKKRAEEENAKKRVADEEAIHKAAEEAKQQADTNSARKKAEGEAANRKAALDCDRLAASPNDVTRPSDVTGVDLFKIDTKTISTACDAAMLGYPEVVRFAYQAGRVADAKKDYERAVTLYAEAAKKGHVAAMTELGWRYFFGREGRGRDDAEARRWFERAAAKDDTLAMSGLGSLYKWGNVVRQDFTEARNWYERAAKLGDAQAMNSIGELSDAPGFWDIEAGSKRVKLKSDHIDYIEASKWYREAAKLGNATAMFNLGILYEQGHGVTKDLKQAREWYQNAANAGSEIEARDWYLDGAARGSATAMFNLGDLYERGHGVSKDLIHARGWYKQAADMGNEEAKAKLRSLK